MNGWNHIKRRDEGSCACPQAASLLSAYADRELSWEDERWVARHLCECDACSQEYRELLATKRAVASLEAVQPCELPAGLWDELRPRITGQARAGSPSSAGAEQGQARPAVATGAPGTVVTMTRPRLGGRTPGWAWLVVPTVVAAMLLVGYRSVLKPGRDAARVTYSDPGTVEPVGVGTLLREHALSVMRRPFSDGVSLTYLVTNSLGDVSRSR